MTDKVHTTNFSDGDVIHASDWNDLAADVNELKTTSTSVADTVVSISSKGNTEISSAKHINLEPAYDSTGGSGTYGDLQIKPGDDITLESSHRAASKRDEITIKAIDGSKVPVKLQVMASDLTLSTKGKQVEVGSNDSSNVMNVNVTTGSGKGYLKVRAQAIDLRCEDNGGIALQPKGNDSNSHQNKIKFEHDGGDGLEFGTFNTQKTSIFTDEYRFNKNGVIYAVVRDTPTVQSYKEDGVTPKKTDYPTQNDDFKDIPVTIEGSHCTWDSTNGWEAPSGKHILQCTWEDIVTYICWAKLNNQGPFAVE